MDVNSSRTPGGSVARRYSAVSACTVMTDMWCATTSCSSRAMRARSSSSVRRPRSASLIVSCSTSLRCTSYRSRSTPPSRSATPPRMVNSSSLAPEPCGAANPRPTLAPAVASHTSTSVRRRSRRPRARQRATYPTSSMGGNGHSSRCSKSTPSRASAPATSATKTTYQACSGRTTASSSGADCATASALATPPFRP
ncbi:hypothetical protein RKD29_003865 [Streptomyces tendae]